MYSYQSVLIQALDKVVQTSTENNEPELYFESAIRHFRLPKTQRDISEVQYGDVLKRLLEELLSLQAISKKHLDDILYLIDIGKIQLITQTDSKIVLYVNMLIRTIQELFGVTSPRVLAFYNDCERKVFILVDSALFSDIISFIFRRVSTKTAMVFYTILTHELTHMIAAELPKHFMTIFRNDLLKWYKTFTDIVDPLDIYLNPPSKIVNRLYNFFEKTYHNRVCKKGGYDVAQVWNQIIVSAWFKSDVIIVRDGKPHLDISKIPEGYYRDLLLAFYHTLRNTYLGHLDKIPQSAYNLLYPAFEMAYSSIRVPYPGTFFHQELLYPSEVSSVAVMYRPDLAEKVWSVLKFIKQ